MKFIIFNWKSYLNFDESNFLTKFISKTKFKNKYNLIVAPSSFSLGFLKNKYKNVNFSGQNFDFYGKGGFTSFMPISDLSENNINYALIGHSEVRQYRKENNSIVNLKLKLTLDTKITPIVCIGEDLNTYKKKLTTDYLKKQIIETFDKNTQYKEVFIAYEPLWAIGSGLVPTNDEISKIADFINFFLKDYSFKKLKILYGGSVNSENLEQLSKIKELDGFLVGSASIKKSFINKFKL
ncbi:MAG: triose-phosphate isomerase [Alphaproteobacteria bacterium]